MSDTLWNLTGHYGGSTEGQRANKNADSEVTRPQTEILGWNWTRGHSNYILAKNMAVFCLCLDNVSRAEFKSNELMCLAEEISLQQSTEPVAWLLLTPPAQVNNERGGGKKGKYSA